MITEAKAEEVEVLEPTEPSEIIVGANSFFGAGGRIRVTLGRDVLTTAAEVNSIAVGSDDSVAGLLDAMASESGERANRMETSVSAWIDAGVSALAARNTAASSRAFERARELEPSNTRATLGLARVLKEQGKVEEAVDLLQPLFKADPTDPEVRVSFSLSLLASGKLDAALDLLDIDTPVASRYAGLFAARGSMFIAKGNYRSAIGDLRKVIRVRPDWVYARNALGIAEAKTGDLPGAEQRFREAMRLAPLYSEAMVNLVKILESDKRWLEVVDLAERYWTPTSAPFDLSIRVGTAALNADDSRLARDWLQEAVAKASAGTEKAWALNNLGVAYDRLGKSVEAGQSFYDSATEQASDFAFANFARVLLEQGQTDAALEWLGMALSSCPQGTSIRQTLAIALLQSDRVEGAIAVALELLKEKSADPWSYTLLGYLYTDGIPRYDEAIAVLKRGIHLWPSDPALWNNLTYALILSGRLSEAEENIARLSKM